MDDGITTLLTPPIDMQSINDPYVSYYRWYSNDEGGSPNDDVFDVEITNNGGANWHRVERVGPGGPGTAGGWISHRFRVADFVPPNAQIQMRFIASDHGAGSIVEAAIDDLRVVEQVCSDGIGTLYCTATSNSTGGVASIISSGSAIVAQNDLVLTAVGLPWGTNGYFIVSRDQAFVMNPGGSQGNLCVGANTGRYISQLGNSGLSGSIPLTVDVMTIPQATGDVVALPGDTFNFQCWYRDTNPNGTSNMSRGYSVLFL